MLYFCSVIFPSLSEIMYIVDERGEDYYPGFFFHSKPPFSIRMNIRIILITCSLVQIKFWTPDLLLGLFIVFAKTSISLCSVFNLKNKQAVFKNTSYSQFSWCENPSPKQTQHFAYTPPTHTHTETHTWAPSCISLHLFSSCLAPDRAAVFPLFACMFVSVVEILFSFTCELSFSVHYTLPLSYMTFIQANYVFLHHCDFFFFFALCCL